MFSSKNCDLAKSNLKFEIGFWRINMRAHLTVIALVAMSSFAPALGADTATRYFTSLNDFMDGDADIVLKETRLGNSVKSAVLDVCYSVSPGSDTKDRFIVNLSVSGANLAGSTESTENKTPVKVNLTQTAAGGKFNFVGKIGLGSKQIDISSKDNTDSSEADFKKSNEEASDTIEATPKNFTELSPGSIAARVKLAAAADIFKLLRGENVQVPASSFKTYCDAMRREQKVIYITVDPARAAALIGKLKTTPGVISAGWTTGGIDMERTIRFASAPWTEGGKIKGEKISQQVIAVLEKTLSAKHVSTKWNDTTGTFTFVFKRPSKQYPQLALTETIEVDALFASETPTSSANTILWIDYPSSEMSDDAANPKLNIENESGQEEEGAPVDENGTIETMTKEFKAQRWDSDQSKWVSP
jgi:hypothetical protein